MVKKVIACLTAIFLLTVSASSLHANHETSNTQFRNFPASLVLFAQAPVFAATYGVESNKIPEGGIPSNINEVIQIIEGLEYTQSPTDYQKRLQALAETYQVARTVANGEYSSKLDDGDGGTDYNAGDIQAFTADKLYEAMPAKMQDRVDNNEVQSLNDGIGTLWGIGAYEAASIETTIRDHGVVKSGQILIGGAF